MAQPDLDRLAELRIGGPDRLRRFLRAVPIVGEQIAGHGPLAGFDGWGRRLSPAPARHLQEVAEIIARPLSIDAAITSCDTLAYQVLVTVTWLGGRAERDEVLRLAPGLRAAGLAEAVGQLDDRLLLAISTPGPLALRPGVRDRIRLPGRLAAVGLQWVSHGDLGRAVTAFGVKAAPQKEARIEQLLVGLSDAAQVRRVVAALPRPSRELFDRLIEHREAPITLVDPRVTRYSGILLDSPLGGLMAAGLVGTDRDRDACFVWSEVAVALAGSLFPSWSRPPAPTPQPVRVPERGGVPSAVRLLGQLMAAWRLKPAPALKTGGLGVSTVRSLAKQVGAVSGEVGFLLVVAFELGLVDTTVAGRRGRGRNQEIDLVWGPTGEWDGFAAQDPTERWRILIQGWFDARYLLPGPELPERFDRPEIHTRTLVQRVEFCRYLAALPMGTGVTEAELGVELCARSISFNFPEEVASLVAAARALGLVGDGTLVGLTGAGRRFVTGDGSDEPAPGEETFIVQADHTVIVPPDLNTAVEQRLDSFAELESSGGARVYRIGERTIAGALDRGDTGEGIGAFLIGHSSVPVPANVLRTISDTASRHGVLRVGSSTSWVVTDDPVALAAALKVKNARLVRLNATTAVSTLAEADLTAALRGKRLSPISDAELRSHREADTVTPFTFAVRDTLLPTHDALAELAEQLLDAPIPPPPPPRQSNRDAALSRAILERQIRAEMQQLFDD